MSWFHIFLIVIVVGSLISIVCMRFMQDIIALPHKEYIILFILLLVVALYNAYLMMPDIRDTDAYKVQYSKPRIWEKERC